MLGKNSLGTANFNISWAFKSKISNQANIKKILDFCDSNYINIIDTAIDYHKVEDVIGAVECENFDIITKLPNDKNNYVSLDQLEKIISNSF